MHKRTRRNYDGIQPTGKKITDLLPDFLQEISGSLKNEDQKIFQLWFSLIGEKMAAFTKPTTYKNGVLTIKVKSATLYALLSTYEKPRLLKAMQAEFQVKEIVFRVG